MDNSIISALNHLNVCDTGYQEWVNVGMALKAEGYSCDVWDEWSQGDHRYKIGECQKKWNSFNGASNPVTGATIVQMAKDRGWRRFDGDGCLDWNATIQYDGGSAEYVPDLSTWDPVSDLKRYLEILFDKNDHVSYVTESDIDTDGRWKPVRAGFSDRTAGQLIASLDKHPDDIAATIGDWKKEAGAWIRFNPVDGHGVKNENVTSFKYALVESDDMPVSDQEAMYRKLELPIAVMVNSGGKSLHAIVKVDAENYDEYRKRVEFLYDFLHRNGVTCDKQNRNPSRLSRMPGVTRGDRKQFIVAENVGRRSWSDWMDFAEGVDDELPEIVYLTQDLIDNPPPLAPEIIEGVLRCGHKMLISGSSKAGKSWLLAELAIALSEGMDWIGFKCRKSKVLYVNLEIAGNSCLDRFSKVYNALGLKLNGNLGIWNLRGKALPLDKLVPKLIRRMQGQHYDAVIIDPIYKVITGDENNASDMGAFCNQFDKIATETGCAVIYCHHHSKGAQGNKRAMDRASGSGVFARDPDAQLDMIELELTDNIKNTIRDGNATAFRVECSLREFANFKPVNIWFECPLHRVDNGVLNGTHPEGSIEANLTKSSKRTSPEDRFGNLETAVELSSPNGYCTVKDISEYLGINEKTVRAHLKEFGEYFSNENGIVTRILQKPLAP